MSMVCYVGRIYAVFAPALQSTAIDIFHNHHHSALFDYSNFKRNLAHKCDIIRRKSNKIANVILMRELVSMVICFETHFIIASGE